MLHEEIVGNFFTNLSQANYDKAKDFMVIFIRIVYNKIKW